MGTCRPTQPEDSTSTGSAQKGRRSAQSIVSIPSDPVVPFRQLGPKLTLIGQVYLPGSKKISLSVKPLTVRADDTYSRGAGLLRVLITPVGRSVLREPGDYIQRRGEASAAA